MRFCHLLKIGTCLIVSLLITSCAVLRTDSFVNGQIKLDEENLHLLNGSFNRTAVKDSIGSKQDLFGIFYDHGFNVGPDSLCSVNIEVINHKSLKVTLKTNDSIVKSKVIKGKIKNGYFEIRRRYLIVPAAFLNVFRTSKARIGLLQNENLTTDYKQVAWGTGFFIVPFASKDRYYDNEFKKIAGL